MSIIGHAERKKLRAKQHFNATGEAISDVGL
jgi:hypothetical protein